MRIRMSASSKSNRLNNDIQIDHLVSCKRQLGVIFQNTTFVQQGQSTVSSFGGQSFLLSLYPWAAAPLIRTPSVLVSCVWMFACGCACAPVLGGGRQHKRRLALLFKMILFISSVWEKENVKIKKKQKETKKKSPKQNNFYASSQNFVVRSTSHPLLFSSLLKSCRLVSYLMKYYRPAWNENGL